MLEELRRETNDRENAVAIGVTFNNNTGYDTKREKFVNVEGTGVNIMLSIICRICCVIYHDPVKGTLNNQQKSFILSCFKIYFFHWSGILIDASKSLKCHDSTDEMLLTEFIQHVMKQLTINGMVVKDFVLLLGG
jgi:hypothetical protein